MLSASKEIITTPKNINTEIGIAKFILATDFSDKDIFVVEMGAYRVGEIELICNMCQPTIGILTAINETHLSLFGSIKHTQQAKYELLRSLPREGLAITNMDNQYCRELLDTLHCHVETFGCDDEFNPTLMVTDITHKKGLLSATYCRNTDNACIRTQTKTPGLHNALNIAPCLLVGAHLGVSLDDMTTAINERLQNPQKVLSIYEAGKATIIDDSYNANPDGFKAALTVLGSYPSTVRKVVITRGMLELGEQSDEIHTRIAEEISFFADELIITHPDAAQSLKQGLIKKYKQTSARTVYHPEKLLWEVGELLQERSVLLIENQIPSVVYQFIQSKRQSDEDPA
jgi:UDP-N-acetylmuramoyl-tripeptide--D-alanyl-D-alanine ligase